MKVNWKVRFKNSVWVASFLSLLISFVYSMLKIFDVVPTVPQATLMDFVNEGLKLLGLVGILVDPTTAGLSDSERAMKYTEPYKDVD